MKKLFLFFLMLLSMFMFVGCGALQPKDSICSKAPPGSLICQNIENPEMVDLLLRLSNDEMLYKGEYTVAEAETFLNALEEYITDVETYSDLVVMVNDMFNILPYTIRNKIFILSNSLALLSADIPICDFDRMLLLQEVAAQKEIVLNFK